MPNCKDNKLSWDEKHMKLALLVSERSKDRSRKTAAVIVDQNESEIATGYNGFPRGVDDNVDSRHERPAKYKWTEHAERNAIYNAARSGIRTEGCRMYMPWYPCMDCARAVIQAGIGELVCYEPDWNDPIWAKDFADVPLLLSEGGVKVRFIGKR